MKHIIILAIILGILMSCKQETKKTQKEPINKTILKPIDLNNWTLIPHIVGRFATEDDIKEGSATFRINSNGEEHKPLNIKIPSLAFQIDEEDNIKTPVIIIQGEQVGEQQLVGIKYLDGSDGVCLLSEVEFVDSISSFKNDIQ